MDLVVEIDRDVCMGSGNCLYWAPGVFDLDDDSIARAVDATAAAEEKILDAAPVPDARHQRPARRHQARLIGQASPRSPPAAWRAAR
ncbi:MAG: ferredoxin [Acidimicrobiales bacterium]